MALRAAVGVALAADTVSIAVMEIVDNAVMLAVPGRWTPASAAGSSGARWRSPRPSPSSRPCRSTAG
jgi:hypothetical protein